MKYFSLNSVAILVILLCAESLCNAQDSILPILNEEKLSVPSPENVFDSILIPISQVFVLLSTGIGIIIAICQYRLKIREEIRLSKSAQSENDVKLLTLFSETIDIANGRKSHIISGEILESLFQKQIISSSDFKDEESQKLLAEKFNFATRIVPVGQASQNSAIAAIGVLGNRYDVLKEPAIRGLESLIKQGIEHPSTEILARLKN